MKDRDYIRNLTWTLNWYRQSELEGALILGRLAGGVNDGTLSEKLVRHSADEARHSLLWAEAIREAGLDHIRIFRSYQSFYRDHGGTPSGIVETLAFTQIFEKRVHRTFLQATRDPQLPEVVRAAFETMIEDEKDHLGWVAEWLRDKEEAPALLKKYQTIDRLVYETLKPYDGKIHTYEGLGLPA